MLDEAATDKERPGLSRRADRDSHFLAAPHVPLPEEHATALNGIVCVTAALLLSPDHSPS
jgi:hypothetical protein